MASVQQQTPNFLGGVSKQPDVRKSPGQLSDIINGNADPTQGLMKRPGFAYVQKIGENNEYLNTKWFHAFRDKKESYFAGILPDGTIKVWDAITGDDTSVVVGTVDGTVTDVTGFNAPYLTGTNPNDYDVLTVQDTTYITNKNFIVQELPEPTWENNTVGTVRILTIEYSASYTVTIDGTDFTVQTRNGDNIEYNPDEPDEHTEMLNADEILTGLKTLIDAGSTGVTVQILKGSLELSSSSSFSLQARGGITNEALNAYQNTVENVTKLAAETINDRVVEIVNTDSDNDGYFTKFVAEDGTSGIGYWKETRGPSTSPGLDVSTMPHLLLSLGLGRWEFNSTDNKYDFITTESASNKYTFMFKPADYTERLVGDEVTNSNPTFVGNTITQAFFFSNRLGFLTSDNISMSQAGEYKNFFHVSALAVIDSDPVDISCSSIRPALLSGVVPVAQGLLLFSKTQQFLLYSDHGNISPSDSIIATISNYDYDIDIEPVSSGTRTNFVCKTRVGAINQPTMYTSIPAAEIDYSGQGYTRVFGMVVRGFDVDPVVVDISAVVGNWIPNNVDNMISSPQNSFIALSSRESDEVHFYRTHSDGEKDVMQAWYKWKVPGNVQAMVVHNDILSMIILNNGVYSIIRCVLNLVQSDTILDSADGIIYGNPCVDMFTKAAGVTYSDDKSYITLPYDDIPDLSPLVMIAKDPLNPETTVDYSSLTATKENGQFVVAGVDLTPYANRLVIGYSYTFDASLPTTYFTSNDKYDFDASLTVSRMKWVMGLSDKVKFKLNSKGSAEWTDINPQIEAKPFLVGGNTADMQTVFHFPIHQRNNHFNIRVVSDSPFPLSVISMVWQGNYSPKFYRRS